jgi:hypothetical protein
VAALIMAQLSNVTAEILPDAAMLHFTTDPFPDEFGPELADKTKIVGRLDWVKPITNESDEVMDGFELRLTVKAAAKAQQRRANPGLLAFGIPLFARFFPTRPDPTYGRGYFLPPVYGLMIGAKYDLCIAVELSKSAGGDYDELMSGSIVIAMELVDIVRHLSKDAKNAEVGLQKLRDFVTWSGINEEGPLSFFCQALKKASR